MIELAEKLSKAQRALFALEMLLRSQVGSQIFSDPMHPVQQSLRDARSAVAEVAAELSRIK